MEQLSPFSVCVCVNCLIFSKYLLIAWSQEQAYCPDVDLTSVLCIPILNANK